MKSPSLSFDKFGSSSSLSFSAPLPLPILHSVVTIQSLYHLHPVCKPPLPRPTLLCCPPSFPITPPLSLSCYELYYFDPSPSICFNWIMICNHVLSGESIKRAGASAPLLRGLLLFPHPPTHLIQALLLSAFRPPLNTLAHGQPLQPAVGLVKGVERGGIDGFAVDFSWPPFSNGKGLRGTRWSPAGGSGDTGGGEGRKEEGGV